MDLVVLQASEFKKDIFGGGSSRIDRLDGDIIVVCDGRLMDKCAEDRDN